MPRVVTGTVGDRLGIAKARQGVDMPIGIVAAQSAVIEPKQAKFLRWMSPVGMIRAKKVTIPARPFLPIDGSGSTDLPAQWAAEVLQALQAHFEKAAKA